MADIKLISHNLGYYMGEVMGWDLPRLSIDGGKVQVTWGEAKHYKRLTDEWMSFYNKKLGRESWTPAWNEYLKWRYLLKEKYLPHEKKFYLPKVELGDYDLDEIKGGMYSSLWDSDICEYQIEKDTIHIENARDTTIVTLQLALDIPFQQIDKEKLG